MKELKILLSLSFLLLLTVLGLLVAIPRANAATGLVCIADSSPNPASCPSSPASLSAVVGSNITVAVNIQGSDTLNGFDVSVQVDPSVLQPLSIPLTSSVIQDPKTVLVQTVDSNTGVARAAVVALGYFVTGPVTGNLFNIVYRVLSSTKGTSIVFEAGCSGTSFPNTCMTVVNGGTIDPETVQTATFGGAATPDFTINANPLTQTVQQGSSAKSAVTVTSLNAFSGAVNFSLPAMCLAIGCPSWNISPSNVVVASGGTAQATLTFTTFSNTPTITFNVTVTGTHNSLSHSVTVSFKVVPAPTPDFSISANRASQSVQQGSTATSTITATSVNGFSGTVNLSATPPPLCPSCPTWSLNPGSVTISSGGSATSALTFTTAAGSPTTTFPVNVTGTSSSLSHSTTASFTIVATVPPGTVCIAAASSNTCPSTPLMAQGNVGGQLSVAVNVQNSPALNGFDIQVLTDPSVLRPISTSLNGAILPDPKIVVFNSVNSTTGLVRVAVVAEAFLTTPPTTGRFFSITYNIVGTTPGTFILFPVSCPGSSNDSVCVTVTGPAVVPENVLEANFTSTAPPPPDFTIKASPSSLSIIKGQSASSTVTLTSLNGFSGVVTLSATITPSIRKSPGVTLTPMSLSLSPSGSATATLVVSASGGTQAGTYTVTITATSGSLTHTTTVTVTILPRH